MNDSHVHSEYSTDSHAPLDKICRAAIKKGLYSICFTDHIDLECPIDGDNDFFNFDYTAYSDDIQTLKIKYIGELIIRKGVELGLQPKAIDANNNYLKDKYFDLIIGSIHSVNGKELYQNKWLKGIDNTKGIDQYLDDLAICIKQTDHYDVIGHLDVFRRYLDPLDQPFNIDTHRNKITQILKSIIKSNKGIEVNTSNTYYGLKEFHPIPEILQIYHDLGGEIITIGSDSHTADTLGNQFEEAKALLKHIGFTHYTQYQARKPIQIKL